MAAGAGGYLVGEGAADSPAPPPEVAPTIVIEEAPEQEVVSDLGFPAFATLNTTRVGGATAAAVGAGAALASYPSVDGVGTAPAAVLAPAESWQLALAASSLASNEIGLPILIGDEDAIPGFTATALEGLAPSGLDEADGAELVAIGDGVAAPSGFEELRVDGDEGAEVAKRIDRLRARLSGVQDPDHLLVVSSERPELAAPAAAWAARSGDPILFASDDVPPATIETVERHPDADVYVLGGGEAISGSAIGKLRDAAGSRVQRVGSDDPVENAIDFARFSSDDFGWDINDPGHGFVLASTERPLHPAASAPLAAGGKPGPLLLTDSAEELPKPLRGYLLDTKPGYVDDPTRAIYNHVWVLGDESTISLEQQAQVDELVKLVEVRRGTGGPRFGSDG